MVVEQFAKDVTDRLNLQQQQNKKRGGGRGRDEDKHINMMSAANT
jgi:hypothetical protein